MSDRVEDLVLLCRREHALINEIRSHLYTVRSGRWSEKGSVSVCRPSDCPLPVANHVSRGCVVRHVAGAK